jgi:hypothetical protein
LQQEKHIRVEELPDLLWCGDAVHIRYASATTPHFSGSTVLPSDRAGENTVPSRIGDTAGVQRRCHISRQSFPHKSWHWWQGLRWSVQR